jgi:flagellar basal-body rod protein FlgF
MSSRGLYSAASAMMMDLIRMDTVANNLANVNTTGYKRQQTLHHDFKAGLIERMKTAAPYVSQNGNGSETLETFEGGVTALGELGTGTVVSGTYVGFEAGSLEVTSNPLHVALQGTGFFVVETPNGPMYTRNGSFTRNSEGELVTVEGFRVMGENGPILLPETPVSITEKGDVYAGQQYINSLQITDFAEPSSLIRRGSSFFAAPNDALEIAPEAVVLQGNLEHSNVDTAREMVQMITAMRSYQLSQKALQTEDEMTGRLNDLGRPV